MLAVIVRDFGAATNLLEGTFVEAGHVAASSKTVLEYPFQLLSCGVLLSRREIKSIGRCRAEQGKRMSDSVMCNQQNRIVQGRVR